MVAFTPTHSEAGKVKIRIQSVIPTKADEIVMLKDFGKNVSDLTNGYVTIEVLPAGAVVGVKETLEAVDKGLIEGGFAWTHYWSGYHPAAMLFGSPVAGAGVGIDNIAFVSWFMYGGGRELYDQLWKEMGMNVKGLMLQPVGPEALGWFKEPIKDLSELKGMKMRFFGLGAKVMTKIGVSTQLLAGADIYPALERGVIDATEYSMPTNDIKYGFYQIAKNNYFPGWHQQSSVSEFLMNKTKYDALPAAYQEMIRSATYTQVIYTHAKADSEQFGAMKTMREKHGVTIHRWKDDQLAVFEKAWLEVVAEESAKDALFKEFADSYFAFRNGFKIWGDAQALKATYLD